MAAKTDLTLPLDAISKLLDVTPRRVQQLAAEGVIPKAQRGKYELIGSVQGYVKYLRQRAAGVELGSEAFTQQRARLTQTKADLAQMEHARLLGKYLLSEEVSMAWAAIVQNVRTRILTIPAKLGSRILTCKSAQAAQDMMRAEIHEALEELSETNVVSTLPAGYGGGGDAHARAAGAAAQVDDI
jgi:phage terminase Nu1 subunit (DNA packaging protein)